MNRIVRGIASLSALIMIAAAPDDSGRPWDLYPAGWPGFACNGEHWADCGVPSQPLNRIKWSAAVDLNPTGGAAHYGSPMVTPANTVVFPVRTGTSGFIIQGRRASDGNLLWQQITGYLTVQTSWVPPCGCTLTPAGGVAMPESGGRVILRASADSATSTTQTLVFYGAANYAAAPTTYNSRVKINTPITADAKGNLYFGFSISGSTPLNLVSGIARISASGQGSWVSAATAANDASITRVLHNCAPALGMNGKALYLAVRDGNSHGYLLMLDSTTLALVRRVRLLDPNIGGDAELTEFSTASPMVGPDGRVFFGVFDANLNNNDRGWMLQFNSTLTQTLIPGAFGWDDTASVVPLSAVPSYTGPSPYLILTKYNNYAGIGNGTGENKVAVLDPGVTQIDPVSGVTTMKEIMTVLGPTAEPSAGPLAVREWCINSTAIDIPGHCALLNSEDGKLYRWSFDTNTLSQSIVLTVGVGEPYTPTVIGPDGTVYAINNSVICAVGQ